MLLIDETGLITHLNVLLIGSAHVGKSTLRKAFVRGSASHGGTKTRARGAWRDTYDPTIEDCSIVQYMMPSTLPVSVAVRQPSPVTVPAPVSPTESIASGSTVSNDGESKVKEKMEALQEELWQGTGGQRVILTLSDVGGHPFYSPIWDSAIASADAFILVYDVGNRVSYDAMFGFYRRILETKCVRPGCLPIMLLGNMVDNVTSDLSTPLLNKRPRQVTRTMGENLAKLLDVTFNETTAMAPKSVAHCFRQLMGAAQDHAHALKAAGHVPKADSQTVALAPLLRRPSNASVLSEDGERRITSHVAGGIDRVYGQTVRSIDTQATRGSAGAGRESTYTALSEGSALSIGQFLGNVMVANPAANGSFVSSRPRSATSGKEPLGYLTAPRPDSIRFRRDMIFQAWKTSQHGRDCVIDTLRVVNDEKRLAARSNGTTSSSSSRSSSNGLSRNASDSSSHAPHGTAQPSASYSATSPKKPSTFGRVSPPALPFTPPISPLSSSLQTDPFETYASWDSQARQSTASSPLFLTMSSNDTNATNPYSVSRETMGSCGSALDMSYWEGQPLPDQLRERTRQSEKRSPQIPEVSRADGMPLPSHAQAGSSRGHRGNDHAGRSAASRGLEVNTSPKVLRSQRSANPSTNALSRNRSPGSMTRTQRDLDSLLQQLAVFDATTDDENTNKAYMHPILKTKLMDTNTAGERSLKPRQRLPLYFLEEEADRSNMQSAVFSRPPGNYASASTDRFRSARHPRNRISPSPSYHEGTRRLSLVENNPHKLDVLRHVLAELDESWNSSKVAPPDRSQERPDTDQHLHHIPMDDRWTYRKAGSHGGLVG